MKDNKSEETKENSNQNNIADLVSTQTITKQEDNNKVVLNDTDEIDDKIVNDETEKEYSTIITGVAYIGGIIGYGGQLSGASYLPVTITDCAIQNIKVEGTHAVSEAIGEKSYYSGYTGTLVDEIINFINKNSAIISKDQNP